MRTIGNKLGKFVSLDKDWESKVDRRCARILVELDLTDSLFKELVINMHGSQWKQRLDY